MLLPAALWHWSWISL